MIDRPRVDSMAGLQQKTTKRYTTGKTPNTGRVCAIASCGRKFYGNRTVLYCSPECKLASLRTRPEPCVSPEWRDPQIFKELDWEIRMEERYGQ